MVTYAAVNPVVVGGFHKVVVLGEAGGTCRINAPGIRGQLCAVPLFNGGCTVVAWELGGTGSAK